MSSKTETFAVDTGGKQRGRPFRKGESGNPAGRPRGARARFSEAFCKDLLEVWKAKGRTALEIAAETDPVAFIAVCARVLSKEHALSEKANEDANSWIHNIARLSRLKAQEALQ